MIIKEKTPISSFLSVEKDMGLMVDKILKNKRLLRLLHYNTEDALDRPNLSPVEEAKLIGKNIRVVPYLNIEEENMLAL